MVTAILPEYTFKDLGLDGGPYDEMQHPKVIVHMTEGTTIAGAESAFKNYPPHTCYDWRTRDRVQYIRLDRHSYSLRGDENDDEFCIQVELIGYSKHAHELPEHAYENIAQDVVDPLTKAIGVPRRYLRFYRAGENGFILARPDSPIRLSVSGFRNYSGWLGHQHVPSPDSHWDPGGFNMDKAFSYSEGGDVADWNDPQAQDLVWRVYSLLQGLETQKGGGSAGEAIPLVKDLHILMGRIEAIIQGKDNVTWGPSAGEENELQKQLNSIQDEIRELKEAVGSGFTLKPEGSITFTRVDPTP